MSHSHEFENLNAPDVDELGDESHWTSLASKHWSEFVGIRKVKLEVIKEDIWDRLESKNFELRSLVILENLRVLEKLVSGGRNNRISH